MNVVKDLTDRIMKSAATTKRPCKMYKTEQGASKAAKQVAQEVGAIHETQPARFIVFYVEALNAWVGAIDLTEILGRSDHTGGYIGHAAERGFYTY